VQASPAGPATSLEAPAYLIRYTLTFGAALEAGRFFQARLYRRYLLAAGAGLLIGAVISVAYPALGLGIVGACAALVLMAKFAVMDRVFGRRQLRGQIGSIVELSLSDDGIAWAGPLGSGRTPWTSVTEVRTNGRMVLFVAGRVLLGYAPAGSFTSETEQAEVVAFSRRQVAAATAGRRPV
jgi:hypothetical protein